MRLAYLRLLFCLLLVFAAGGCAPSKPAETPLVTDPIDIGTLCESAQERLNALDCSWKVNTKNVAYSVECHRLAREGYARMPDVANCVSHAESCSEAKKCR